jgi:hypothetical protein
MPGASPTVLYPPGGDLRAARRLAPNAHGTAVLYTCNDYPPLCRRPAEQVRSDLAELGLDVDIREFPFDELFERVGREGEPYDIVISHWGADYVDPDNFLNLLTGKVRPEYARKLERVARLSGEARYRAYESLSVELAREIVGRITRSGLVVFTSRSAAPGSCHASRRDKDSHAPSWHLLQSPRQ